MSSESPTPEDDARVIARLALDDRPGPAHRISSARAQAIVHAAIESAWGAQASATAGVEREQVGAPRGLVHHARRSWLAQRPFARVAALAASVLLAVLTGVAAAQVVAWARAHLGATVQVSPAARAPSSRPSALPPRVGVTAELAEEAEPALPAEADRARDAIEPALDLRKARAGTSRTREAREVALEDRLQRANRARAAGDFRAAAALYARVYEDTPSSLSAYVALVAAGSLELEHLDHPARARTLFEAALRARPRGALDLEARQGLVLALRDLGARDEEVAALRKLVAAHPARPAAARARARLVELGE